MTHPLNPTSSSSFETSPNRDSLSHDSEKLLLDLSVTNQLRELQTVTPNGKTIEVDGRSCLNLASNDYLGLSQHIKLINAAIDATKAFGVGSGASRLVSGTLPIHVETEQRLAKFKHAEAALLLPTGYTANLAALTTLAGKGDLIVLDKLVHASLIDAARASGAEVRTYPHLNLERAEQLLKRNTTGRRLLVSDSVFSMDGDCADLPALCDLADQAKACLVIDEAHGTGVLGDDGSGLATQQGVAERIYKSGTGGIVISTASKALGSLGGLISADRPIIDLLINKARPLIYSTAVPPAQCAAITAALDVVRDEPERRQTLERHVSALVNRLADQGWVWTRSTIATPIIPLIVGSEQAALQLSARLLDNNIFAPAIRPPTVAPDSSRVRLSLRADLTADDIETIGRVIGVSPH